MLKLKDKSKWGQILPSCSYIQAIHLNNQYAIGIKANSLFCNEISIERYHYDVEKKKFIYKELASKIVDEDTFTRVFGHRFTKYDVEYAIENEEHQIRWHQEILSKWEERLQNTDWEDKQN